MHETKLVIDSVIYEIIKYLAESFQKNSRSENPLNLNITLNKLVNLETFETNC